MADSLVHPTAIISDGAQVPDSVSVGAYAIIEDGVVLGENCKVGSHAVILGPTTLGANNTIGRHAVIGADPQDLKYKGEETFLTVGDGNFFGDFSQICRGTAKSHDRTTKIGNNNFLMAYVHVGHDCIFSDYAVVANAVQFAGHVEMEDHVHVGGLAAVHQFCLIGRYAMVSGASALSGHAPPYVRVAGYNSTARGLNAVGLQRSDEFTSDDSTLIKKVYRAFFKAGESLEDRMKAVTELCDGNRHVQHFIDFITRCGKDTAAGRPISRAPRKGEPAE